MANNTKERPILFSGEMVRAILDGRKTMSRRVAKNVDVVIDGKPLQYVTHEFVDVEKNVLVKRSESLSGGKFVKDVRCPYGKVGDRLWVKETWADLFPGSIHGRNYAYKASDLDVVTKWKSPRFMPKAASRITLEIANIRVKRLNEISGADAILEGIDPPMNNGFTFGYGAMKDGARTKFKVLWDKINGKKHPWSDNPWVWVVEFKRLENGE